MRASLALLMLAAFLVYTGKAAAHAVLMQTVPSEQSVVDSPPPQVLLLFNEVVEPIAVELLDSTGHTLTEKGAVSGPGEQIALTLPAKLANGVYVVSYRVTSADGHPVGGSYVFAVGPPPTSWIAPPTDSAGENKWLAAAVLGRAFQFSALLVMGGGLLFLLLFHKADVQAWSSLRKTLLGAGFIGGIATVAGVFLQGGLLLDADSGSPLDLATWRIGLSSTQGVASAASLVGLIAAGAALLLPVGRIARGIGTIGVVLIPVSFALTGHVATAEPRWLAIPTLVVHVGFVMFWIGSFLPLLQALRQAGGAATFKRFSQVALAFLPQLVVAGLIIAFLQVQDPAALITTDYGRVLCVKVALVAFMFALAAYNRWRLTPRLASGSSEAAMHLNNTVRLELGLGFVALALAAFLSETAPPRSILAHAHGNSALSHLAGAYSIVATDHGQALIQVVPARAGWNMVSARILDANLQPLKPLQVDVELSLPERNIEPFVRPMNVTGDGYFEHGGPELAVPGRWTVRVRALINDFERTVFEAQMEVK